jgi:hypothetical protein
VLKSAGGNLGVKQQKDRTLFSVRFAFYRFLKVYFDPLKDEDRNSIPEPDQALPSYPV